MFEEIALSISTVLFFLCTVVVGSVLPSEPADTDSPSHAIVLESKEESELSVYSSAYPAGIVGKWNSGGKSLEFQNNGLLLFGKHAMKYSLSGSTLTVEAEIDGNHRVFTLTCETVNDRIMKLNGITFMRAN